MLSASTLAHSCENLDSRRDEGRSPKSEARDDGDEALSSQLSERSRPCIKPLRRQRLRIATAIVCIAGYKSESNSGHIYARRRRYFTVSRAAYCHSGSELSEGAASSLIRASAVRKFTASQPASERAVGRAGESKAFSPFFAVNFLKRSG